MPSLARFVQEAGLPSPGWGTAQRHAAITEDLVEGAFITVDGLERQGEAPMPQGVHGCWAKTLGHRRRVWFSDDLEWVGQRLARDGDLLCPPDATRNDGGEIALIASCATRIIANSSFSWWGGWLGAPSSPTHPVIAPSTWFADGHSDAGELVPRDWVRL